LIELPDFSDWFQYQKSQACRVLLGFGEPGAGKTFAWYVQKLRTVNTVLIVSKAHSSLNIYVVLSIDVDLPWFTSTAIIEIKTSKTYAV
jgi:hypothetical protein